MKIFHNKGNSSFNSLQYLIVVKKIDINYYFRLFYIAFARAFVVESLHKGISKVGKLGMSKQLAKTSQTELSLILCAPNVPLRQFHDLCLLPTCSLFLSLCIIND